MTRRELYSSVEAVVIPLYGAREGAAVAERLCEDCYGVSRFALTLEPNESVNCDAEQLKERLDRLATGEPVQYVVGHTEFYGREFEVGRGVLIPRPETEELVALVVGENDVRGVNILDVGTGSGAIAVSLAAEIKESKVSAIDFSADALEIARRNAARLGVDVEFTEADIFAWSPVVESLDVIVSNPPYIPESERATMRVNVVEFEPPTALFVPDNDPLIFYRQIADVALSALRPSGRLYFEIHETLAAETASMLRSKGYEEVRILSDMNSKPRMIACRKRG